MILPWRVSSLGPSIKYVRSDGEGGGGWQAKRVHLLCQKNVTFECTYFVNGPFTPMHYSVTGGGGAYPNCLYGDGIGVCVWGGGGNYEKCDVGGRRGSTQ